MFTLSYRKGAPVSVEMGAALDGYTDDTKVDVIGRILLTLGQRFIGGSVVDDEDWDED